MPDVNTGGAIALRLVLAIVLALPVAHGVSTLLLTASFLGEFLGHGGWRPLSALTRDPAVRSLSAGVGPRAVPVDLYAGASFRRRPALVLVHGLSPQGKDEPRLREAAALLARAGWAVAVPTVEGLTVLRLRPEDAGAVSATIRALRRAGYQRVAVLGISLGAGPALLAASEPEVAGQLSAALALGGYGSAVELLRYTLTGAYAYAGISGRHAVTETAIAQFARANADLVDEAGRRLVDNRDPAAVDGLVQALPQSTRDLLDALSPARTIGGLRAPLFLIHGRQDPAVPFTESLRLADAARSAGRPVRLAIVGVLAHVEPSWRSGIGDLLRLWATFYAFRRASER